MQINLDFSQPRLIDDGKKTERITFTASSDLKDLLEFVSKKVGREPSVICRDFVSKGIKDSIGDILLTQGNLDRTLGDLLRKG